MDVHWIALRWMGWVLGSLDGYRVDWLVVVWLGWL